MISKQQCDMFDRVCYLWLKSKGGDDEKQMLKQTRVTYKTNLFQKLKDEYKKQWVVSNNSVIFKNNVLWSALVSLFAIL